MRILHSRLAAIAALSATLSLGAVPAFAKEMPVEISGSPSGAVLSTAVAEQSLGDPRGYRRYRSRNRVGAGEVIAGVLVLGTIAAIATSGRNRDSDRYDEREYRDRRNSRDDVQYDSRGIERAVDMCTAEIERGRENVETVDEAQRTTDGWRVTGELDNGSSWNCWIGNDGRIRDISYGSRSVAYDERRGDQYMTGPDADQWDDAAYARARQQTRTAIDGEYTYRDTATSGSYEEQPPYPGGPLASDEQYDDDRYDTSDDSDWESDGRYETARAPDFE